MAAADAAPKNELIDNRVESEWMCEADSMTRVPDRGRGESSDLIIQKVIPDAGLGPCVRGTAFGELTSS